MQQQKIDFAEPQPLQTIARGTWQIRRGAKCDGQIFVVRKTSLALDAGCAQTFADLGLVVVHFGGIDVAVAEPQRCSTMSRANVAAQIPCAEAEQRDARAIGSPPELGLYCCTHCRESRRSKDAVTVPCRQALRMRPAAPLNDFESARAGPRGERLPCSQLRTVSTGTPICAAKAVCVNPVSPAHIARVHRIKKAAIHRDSIAAGRRHFGSFGIDNRPFACHPAGFRPTVRRLSVAPEAWRLLQPYNAASNIANSSWIQ